MIIFKEKKDFQSSYYKERSKVLAVKIEVGLVDRFVLEIESFGFVEPIGRNFYYFLIVSLALKIFFVLGFFSPFLCIVTLKLRWNIWF